MIIRDAMEGDLKEIMRLLFQINSEHYEHAPTVFARPEENEPDYWLRQILDPEQLFLVAESGTSLHGMITANISENSDTPFLSPHQVCRVGTIVVDFGQRGSGVGRLLMANAERWATARGAKEIRLEVMEFNQRAQSFYQKDGYETQSRILSKRIAPQDLAGRNGT